MRDRGAIAQLGERLDRTQEVGGSSPPSSTSKGLARTRFFSTVMPDCIDMTVTTAVSRRSRTNN